MVMGYHAQRHYEGVRAILSAGGNLTVDVATGSNEASTIVAGGKVDLRGTWENKSDYDIFSRSWVALDEAIANMDGKVDERWAEGEHMHLSSMDRIEYDGMDAMADGSLAQPRREAVWDYTENELGFDEDAIAIGTGWLAMQATVPFAGVADESYLRFRLIEDYKEDVVHERGIIDGHGGTNVTLLDDDYGVSWAGQGGAEVASLHNLWKPLTGLSPGTKTVAPINAAASVANLDLSGLAVPHSPVAELAVNVAAPVAPDVNLAIALGDLDSAPHVGLDVLESRLPTASSLPQAQAPLGQNVTFTLSGYEPLTSLPPGNVPTPDGTIGGSGAGLPGYVFTSSSFGPNPTTGTLPDYYRDGNTLNGYTPTEPDTGTLPNVTLSQSLLEKLTAGPSTLGPLLNTDVLRQNVRETLDLEPESTFDPDALREASAESSAHLLRTKLTDSLDPTVDIKLGDLIDDEVRQSLAEHNTLGTFGGKSVIDFAGPMLNEGSEGVNVLETLEGPPELKDIIAQRHEYYLQQEAELKLKREEWVNQKLLEEYFGDMGHNGWMPEMTPKERAELIAELRANPMFASLIADLETKALDEVGRSHYELIKAQTDAQKQRLHLEMFPPPPPPEPDGGFFGSIFGMIVLAIVAIVVSVFTAGAAIGFMAGGWAGAMAGGAAAFSGGLAAAAGAGAAAGGFVVGTAASAAVVAAASTVTAGMVASAIGGFVSGVVTGSLRMIETGGKWFKQVVIPAGVSALAAAATYGIGHGIDWGSSSMGPNVPYINQSVGEMAIKPALHGLVQGLTSELQGGGFSQGFISGAVGSVAGSISGGISTVLKLEPGVAHTMINVALAGASGGAVNTATGGDFWEGFATASSVALFNDAMGYVTESKLARALRQERYQKLRSDLIASGVSWQQADTLLAYAYYQEALGVAQQSGDFLDQWEAERALQSVRNALQAQGNADKDPMLYGIFQSKGAAAALAYLDQRNHIINGSLRMVGAVGLMGEVAVGTALVAAPDASGLTKAGGVLVLGSALDNAYALTNSGVGLREQALIATGYYTAEEARIVARTWDWGSFAIGSAAGTPLGKMKISLPSMDDVARSLGYVDARAMSRGSIILPGGGNQIYGLNRAKEIAELFNSSKARNGIQIGSKTLMEVPNNGNAKIFAGASEAEVKQYFTELTGVSQLPIARIIPGKGTLYTVQTSHGNFNLRDFSTSASQTGPAWTLDLPKGITGTTYNPEIKFLK